MCIEAMIPQLMAGEAAAFDALYDQLAPRLYGAALALVEGRSEAEDVVQETFVALMRYRGRLGGVQDLEAYLFIMLRHVAHRHRKNHWRALGFVARAARELWMRRPAAGVAAEPRDDLAQALDRLPARQREVVILKVYGELTFAQIATVLGIGPNTAASRYRYALEKLRNILGDEP